MKTITVDEEQNWLQDNTKFKILKSVKCACAAIFMNLIRNGLNDCKVATLLIYYERSLQLPREGFDIRDWGQTKKTGLHVSLFLFPIRDVPKQAPTHPCNALIFPIQAKRVACD